MIKLLILALLLTTCHKQSCFKYDKMIPTSGASFNDDLKECRIRVVYKGADWCSSCQEVRPYVEHAAKEYSGIIKILFIDATEPRPDINIGNGYVPFFRIYVDDKISYEGNADAKMLEQIIKGAIISLSFKD